MRAAAFALALLALPLQASAADLTSSGSVRFKIQIPLVMRLMLHDHPGRFEVTAEDAARGYVVVRGPRIETIANHPRGYSLQVRLASQLVAEVAIEGLATPVVARGEAQAIPMPPTRTALGPRPVAYRMTLAAGVAPGTYAWPVHLGLFGT